MSKMRPGTTRRYLITKDVDDLQMFLCNDVSSDKVAADVLTGLLVGPGDKRYGFVSFEIQPLCALWPRSLDRVSLARLL